MEEKKLAEGAPQSGCVDEPVLFDGYGSYFPKPLEHDGVFRAVTQKPISSVYKDGKFFVRVVKIDKDLPYGGARTYNTMILENGTITPLGYNADSNNYEELVAEHGIIHAGHQYKLYDNNFICRNFPGTPEGYYVGRLNFDEHLVTVYKEEEGVHPSCLYVWNEDKSISPIVGLPEGGTVYEVRDECIADVYIDNVRHQYFYDKTTQSIRPFEFVGLGVDTYEVDFVHLDQHRVLVKFEGGQKRYVFDGSTHILTEVLGENGKDDNGGDRYNVTTGLYCSYETKTVTLLVDKEQVPFTGLADGEKIDHAETYQLSGLDKTVVVVTYQIPGEHFPRKECRWYNNKTGEIRPITGIDTGWQVKAKLGTIGSAIGINIKIPGFGDDCCYLLNKACSHLMRYDDLLIIGIGFTNKTLVINTKEGPNVSVTLSDADWDAFMLTWDPEYVKPQNEIIDALQ